MTYLTIASHSIKSEKSQNNFKRSSCGIVGRLSHNINPFKKQQYCSPRHTRPRFMRLYHARGRVINPTDAPASIHLELGYIAGCKESTLIRDLVRHHFGVLYSRGKSCRSSKVSFFFFFWLVVLACMSLPRTMQCQHIDSQSPLFRPCPTCSLVPIAALSQAMRRILMGLGILDWILTQFCRRDLGRQVASGTIPWRLSSSGPPKVATAGVLPPVAGQLPAQPQYSRTHRD